MRGLLIAAAVLLMVALGGVAFISVLGGHREEAAPAKATERHEEEIPRRVISLSPSTTEILFALGLGDRIVGVSRYCRFPPEARSKPQLGGYLDPNYEAIMAARPDLVILRDDKEQYVKGFDDLGLSVLAVNHKSVEGILDSIGTIGRRCGAASEAERLVADLRARIAAVSTKTAGLPRLTVLVVADRTLATGAIQNAYVAGSDDFMNRMIALAGGKNACSDVHADYPVVSGEGILHMNPQVILDLVAENNRGNLSREEILRDWRQLSDVAAVRTNRVYLVDDDYAFIPGPRIVLLIEKFARLIHPEAFDSAPKQESKPVPSAAKG